MLDTSTIRRTISKGSFSQKIQSEIYCFRAKKLINLHYCAIPRSLEYQVAKTNTVKHNLCISNSIQNNDHGFLNEVANLSGLSIKELIENSFELLQNEVWVKKIINLIEGFECT